MLALQFRGDDLPDFDSMINLEGELASCLGTTAQVDGHDMGSGEINIFIITAEPKKTFLLVKPLLERSQGFETLRAAYRGLDSEEYTMLWPADSAEVFSVR